MPGWKCTRLNTTCPIWRADRPFIRRFVKSFVPGSREVLIILRITLGAAASHGLIWAQSMSPKLDVRVEQGNVVFGLSSQLGFFYTWQKSSDLSNWVSNEAVFAGSTALSLTETVSALSGAEFVKAKVNRPNLTVITNYAGWTNAVLLNNGLVEAVIVPPAGRVLQFRFLGSSDGALWENHNLYGQTASPTSWNTEGSFGGDKSWPSPQSDWGWPPPSGFDGSPNQVAITNGVVVLSSPEDPTY